MTDAEKQEALESIALIRNLMGQSQSELRHSGGGLISIIWGIFSLLGYGGSYLIGLTGRYHLEAWWWPFLSAVAFLLSVQVIRRRAATESAKVKGTMVRYFLLFWIPLVLLMAVLIAFCLALPDLPMKYMVPFIMLVVSTGYLMLGMIFNKSILVMGVVGFAGTVVTTLFFIEQAGLILSLLFGAGLIVTGLFLNRKG